MLPPTVAELYTDYPGVLENEPTDRVQRFLDRAIVKVKPTHWAPEDYPLAIAYLTLHFVVSNPLPGSQVEQPPSFNGIPLSQVKQVEVADEYSITFKTDKEVTSSDGSGDGTLASTRWGRMFLELKQMTSIGGARFGRNCEPSIFEQGFRQVGGY